MEKELMRRSLLAVVLAATAVLASAVPAAAVPKPIIGGTPVADDTYPFMVTLQIKGEGPARDRHNCGGSLLSAWEVITAAHCVGSDPSRFEVVVGRTVLSSNQGQVRPVADILRHPKYRKEPGNDLALLWLSEPITGITPVKLPTPGTDSLLRPGQEATVIGWGATDTNYPATPDRLRQVNVPIIHHDECAISEGGSFNPETDVCAGRAGRDSCWGDSGGPLFRTPPGKDAPYQIGVVSRGFNCAEQGGPGVYTSLSSKPLWDGLWGSDEGKRYKSAHGG
ncbi:serine protease [Pseudonocardiaceae bacterium YIM PH 21723]|nr:serine protease [Pseudonocardiaceae bacterium YIM PH 21723]